MLGLETVLFSLFLPSRNHNLHAGITSRMVRCNACMSLRFGSGWLVIYFWICSCTFILNRDYGLLTLPFQIPLGRHRARQPGASALRTDYSVAPSGAG